LGGQVQSEAGDHLKKAWLALAQPAIEMRLEPGEVLMRAGEEAGEVYLVLEGRLEVEGTAGTLAVLGPGDVVGELGAVTGGARSATVRCASPARVVGITTKEFGDLLEQHPDLAADIAREAMRRLRETLLAAHLSALFGADAADLFGAGGGLEEWRHLTAGEVLFHQGDPADSAYLVVWGRLRAEVTDGDSPRVIGESGQGELVGEMALLEDATRTATLYAARDSEVARLSRATLRDAASRRPQAMLDLVSDILRRNRGSAGRRPEPSHTVIGVIAADDGLDLRRFATSLVESLSLHGSCAHLWSEEVDRLLHREGIARAAPDEAAAVRLTQWLDELEHRHRFLVLEADREWNSWTQRAAASADHVILVARSGADPATHPLEERVSEVTHRSRPARRSLILVHEGGGRPASVGGRWLGGRPIDEIYHVRRGVAGDMPRLARILSGRALGLVLGGGGSRGFAHLGVFRALDELGVPIDLVGGSSIGSVMATLPAMDVPIGEMIPLVERQFAGLLDYTPPLVSIIAGRRVTKSMRQIYGDLAIEDLWLPYFCISASLTRSLPVVHRRGDLVTALRASVAIPGVFPPVPYDGELLIDGGVLNNLPGDEMRLHNPSGSVIAVDVAPITGPRARIDYGLTMSGWTALRHRLRRGRDLPAITATMLRASSMGALRDRDRLVAAGVADLYLDIKAPGRGMLDFDQVAEIARLGYEQSLPRLETWLADRAAPSPSEVTGPE
jgi:predicted acylesterase/phospholipase RssA/CRP-like cAMP-binding protein